MSAWPLVLAPTTFTMFGWDSSLVTRTSCENSFCFGILGGNVSIASTLQKSIHQSHLQSNILVLYGMAEDSLQSILLPSLTIFHKVDSAEASLRNLTHHLVPDNSRSAFVGVGLPEVKRTN